MRWNGSCAFLVSEKQKFYWSGAFSAGEPFQLLSRLMFITENREPKKRSALCKCTCLVQRGGVLGSEFSNPFSESANWPVLVDSYEFYWLHSKHRCEWIVRSCASHFRNRQVDFLGSNMNAFCYLRGLCSWLVGLICGVKVWRVFFWKN